MICIILRNIDVESTDYDLLLFGYLKVCGNSSGMPRILLTLIDRKSHVASIIRYTY